MAKKKDSAFDKDTLRRLKSSIESARKKLEPFADDRMEVLARLIGSHHGPTSKSVDIRPVNMIELAVSIYLPNLAANAPQVLVGTDMPGLKAMAHTTELAVNKRMNEIDMEKVVQRVVLDSILCVGVLKVGKEAKYSETIDGPIGDVYACAIDLSDLILDMSAESWETVAFIGHRIRVPLDEAKSNPSYDETERKKLKATPKTTTNPQGGKTPDTLTIGESEDQDEFEDHVELMELYLPRMGGKNGVLLTIPCDGEPVVLQEEDYEGPAGGPYYPLSFMDAPKNIIPSAPAAHWLDLDDLCNALFRKISRQSKNEKTVTGYAGESENDAKRIKDAADLEMVRMDRPDGVKQFTFGGANPVTVATFTQAMVLFKQMAGNLDSLGGLGASANTLGAEQLLGAAASKRMEWLQKQTYSWMARAARAFCWYVWEDSLYNPYIVKKGAGGIEVPAGGDGYGFEKERRKGKFSNYNFSVQPYSMQFRSPAQELSVLSDIFAKFIIPFAAQLEAQGKSVNFDGLLKLVARLAHFKDLDSIITDITGDVSQREGEGPRERRATKPSVSQRIYTRKGATGGANQDEQFMQSMMKMGRRSPSGASA